MNEIPFNTLVKVMKGDLKGRFAIYDDDTWDRGRHYAEIFIGRPIDIGFGISPTKLIVANSKMCETRRNELADRISQIAKEPRSLTERQIKEFALDGLEYAMLCSNYWRIHKLKSEVMEAIQ